MNTEEIILTTLVSAWFILCLATINSLAGFITIKKTKKKERLKDFWTKIIEDKILFSIFILVITSLIIGVVSIFANNDFQDVIDGLQVELFGFLFDVIILVLLFTWAEEKRNAKSKIKKLQNTIDINRDWKSEEAKVKILSAIRELNELEHYEVNLKNVDLRGTDKPNGKTKLDNLKFRKSRFLQTDLTLSNLFNTEFDECEFHYTNFEKADLLKSNLSHSHIQGAKFNKAYLYGANLSNCTITGNTNFDNADLRNVSLENVKFGSATFDNAQVSEDFVEQLKLWNISGKRVFDDYVFVKANIKGLPGKHIYYLMKVNAMIKFMSSDHVLLKDVEYGKTNSFKASIIDFDIRASRELKPFSNEHIPLSNVIVLKILIENLSDFAIHVHSHNLSIFHGKEWIKFRFGNTGTSKNSFSSGNSIKYIDGTSKSEFYIQFVEDKLDIEFLQNQIEKIEYQVMLKNGETIRTIFTNENGI